MQIVSVAARTLRWAITGQGAARGRSERTAVLVEVRSDRGTIGLGEAAPLPGMSLDTLEDAERAIAALAARVPLDIPDREAAFAIASAAALAHSPESASDRDVVATRGRAAPAARFAIETALLDALARERGISLAALLRAPPGQDLANPGAHVGADHPSTVSDVLNPAADVREDRPSTVSTAAHVGADHSSTISTDTHLSADRPTSAHAGAALSSRDQRVPLSAVVDDPQGASDAFAAGIRCLKIKLAAGDDVERVFAIARAARRATLRIDGNRSWPRAEVAARLAALASLPIEYVEEPCADAHLLLAAPLPCKLALDESLAMLAPDELEAALGSPQLAAVVLKPTLLGGLSATLALAEGARRAGVAAIVSHALEGPIGTAACAELALALGGDRAVGLSHHAAIAGWLVEVAQLAADHVHPAAAPGLGFAGLDLAGAERACSAAIGAGEPR